MSQPHGNQDPKLKAQGSVTTSSITTNPTPLTTATPPRHTSTNDHSHLNRSALHTPSRTLSSHSPIPTLRTPYQLRPAVPVRGNPGIRCSTIPRITTPSPLGTAPRPIRPLPSGLLRNASNSLPSTLSGYRFTPNPTVSTATSVPGLHVSTLKKPTTDLKGFCAYTKKKCNQRRMDNFDYCVRHILEDPSAPYKRCTFTLSNSNKQCSNPVPITQAQSFCSQHLQLVGAGAKKTKTTKKTSSRSSSPHPEKKGDAARQAKRRKLNRILKDRGISRVSLAWYSRAQSKPSSSTASPTSSPRNPSSVAGSPCASPTHDDSSDPEDIVQNELEEVLASRAGIDGAKKWHSSFQRGLEHSDDDSDGDSNDFLSAGGPMTQEELLLRRSKALERLQELYQQQFVHLKRKLRTSREKLLQQLKKDEVKDGHFYDPIPTNAEKLNQPPPSRLDLFPRDKQTKRYVLPSGDEASLRVKRLKRKDETDHAKIQTPGSLSSSQKYKCSFCPPYMAPCSFRALPFSRYCLRHILSDPKQQLYHRCAHVLETGSRCPTPLPKFVYPPVCEKHVQLKDFARNPRLCVRVTPNEVTAMMQQSGYLNGESTVYELLGGDLDLELQQLFGPRVNVIAQAAEDCEKNDYKHAVEDIMTQLHGVTDASPKRRKLDPEQAKTSKNERSKGSDSEANESVDAVSVNECKNEGKAPKESAVSSPKQAKPTDLDDPVKLEKSEACNETTTAVHETEEELSSMLKVENVELQDLPEGGGLAASLVLDSLPNTET